MHKGHSIVSATCGGCRSWAEGLDSGGDPERGRCTGPSSENLNKVVGKNDSCQSWVPVDLKRTDIH